MLACHLDQWPRPFASNDTARYSQLAPSAPTAALRMRPLGWMYACADAQWRLWRRGGPAPCPLKGHRHGPFSGNGAGPPQRHQRRGGGRAFHGGTGAMQPGRLATAAAGHTLRLLQLRRCHCDAFPSPVHAFPCPVRCCPASRQSAGRPTSQAATQHSSLPCRKGWRPSPGGSHICSSAPTSPPLPPPTPHTPRLAPTHWGSQQQPQQRHALLLAHAQHRGPI